MTTQTLEMTTKLDVILDRPFALIPIPFPPNSSSTDAPPPLSRPLPLSLCTAHRCYRRGHCRNIPYDNDTILLSNAAIKHQIHPCSVWIFFIVKTRLCSVCHRRRRALPHPPPHPPPPPKPPPPLRPWLAQAELRRHECYNLQH
ncbi:hypothetical protein HKD37_14G039229 [Glycine soja]